MVQRARMSKRLLVILLLTAGLVIALLAGLEALEPTAYSSDDQLVGQLNRGQTNQYPSQNKDVYALHKLYGSGKVEQNSDSKGVAERLKVGVFIANNNNLNMNQPSYLSDGWYWIEWSPQFQQRLTELNITPRELLAFSNMTESWDSAIQPIGGERALRLGNGNYYQCFFYSNKLFINNLTLKNYPFQVLNLPIVLEVNDAAHGLTFDTVRLTPDIKDSGIGINSSINGFVTKGWSMAEFRHQYKGSWGEQGAQATPAEPPATPQDTTKATQKKITPVKARTSWSSVILNVEYYRSLKAAFWELLQPLIVVLAIVILSPSLSSALWDARISIPTTAVLTLVFMQSGYKEALPDLPYLTFLDKIYVLAYGICLACFALYVWSANLLNQSEGLELESQRLNAIAQINRVDRRFQVGCLLALVLGALLSWYA